MLSEVITILECVNIGLVCIFIVMFGYRLFYLRHFAKSQVYLDYYPKLRILFAAIFIILSLTLLIYGIIYNPQYQWYVYILNGGGGECINSCILVIQLVLLRQELKKERPYTGMHIIYFTYLLVISVLRLVFTVILFRTNNSTLTFLILSVFQTADSGCQFFYWLIKKQEFEFIGISSFTFEEFKTNSRKMLIPNRSSINSQLDQNFAYIRPIVNIEKSKFRIILERPTNNNVLPMELDDSLQNKADSLPRNSFCQYEIISQGLYSIRQIKEIYTQCGKFPIESQLSFKQDNLYQFSQKLTVYLKELFVLKQCYQPSVLKMFNISNQDIQKHQEQLTGEEDNVIDQDGNVSPKDYNATHVSVQIYRQLWIDDHYHFYIMVIMVENEDRADLIHRYSDFQELEATLRKAMSTSSKIDNPLQFPPLPNKHLFQWNIQKINERRVKLESYLRKLCNDTEIMKHPQLRQYILNFIGLKDALTVEPKYHLQFYQQLEIVKGAITKTIVKDELITFYEFKLVRLGIQIKGIKKRFNDFVELHQDLKRWMNNKETIYKKIQLPEKHLYTSEANRHEKLKDYLRNVLSIEDTHYLYELAVFLNSSERPEMEESKSRNSISEIMSSRNHNAFSEPIKGQEPKIEMTDRGSMSIDSGRQISLLIEELGAPSPP